MRAPTQRWRRAPWAARVQAPPHYTERELRANLRAAVRCVLSDDPHATERHWHDGTATDRGRAFWIGYLDAALVEGMPVHTTAEDFARLTERMRRGFGAAPAAVA